MPRHKHADLIIALANDTSLEIECFDPNYKIWVLSETPYWNENLQYRIKPKKGDFICEIDGVKWYLGPKASNPMIWADAKSWCEERGCELPPREVLLMCYTKENIRKQFNQEWYWSGIERYNNFSDYAWYQVFGNGYQYCGYKTDAFSVRGVFREEVK